MLHPAAGCDSNTLCLHQWFETQARNSPEAVAVVFEKCSLTYGELDRRANQLAHRLRRQGIGPDVLVALYLERSLEMVVSILGVLKAGGAYLPLDLTYPNERLVFIVEDAKASTLITQRGLAPTFINQEMKLLCIDDDFSEEEDISPEVRLTPDSLAYCIYTSGTTGTPKGVLITHRNVVRLFTATERWFGFAPSDVWSVFHSYAFDVSVFELWGALLYGGRLVIVPYLESRTPADFYELLEREAVTVLSQTPSAFQQLLWVESTALKPRNLSLRYILFAGEKLDLQILKPWFERHGDQKPKLINLYGITETTVHATYRQVTMKDLDGPSVVGLPIPDLEIHLLDENLKPVPEGQPGEICVAGPGLARGYLNRDELTEERFVTVAGTRLYRSGDLARWCSKEDLEYIGRIDNQVKILGYRIELGEIESILHRHPAVRTAVVIANDQRLVAYIVAGDLVPTTTDLRNFALQMLPEYMLPARFVFLDELPLTPNGKVDRRALPDPGRERPNLVQKFKAPETDAELALTKIWADVLEVTPVGVHDNFFELGGDSIRIIKVLVLAQEQGLSLTAEKLFETPTIHGLTTAGLTSISERHKVAPFELISEQDKKLLSADIEDAYPLVALQAGMHYHNEMTPDSGIFHDVFSYRIGFPLNAQKLEDALQRLLERHEILRTAFDFTTYSEPMQLVYKNVSATVGIEDLQALKPELQHEALVSWVDTEKRHAFDYAIAPLVRFHVQQLNNYEFQFIVSFYHAIFDGWSLAILVSEVLSDYVNACKGNLKAVEPPKTGYREYVAQEREVMASAECWQFWADKLEGASLQKLPRWPKSFISGGNEQAQGPEIAIGSEVFLGLKQLAGRAGVPLRTVLLAAHFRTIQLVMAKDEVISGVVMNGRPEEQDAERMLGLFLNVVPMTMDLTGGSWLDLVKMTYAMERAILPYRRYPLSEIQKQIGEGALFEAAFNYVNWHVFKPMQEELGIEFSEGHYFEANNFTLLANFTLDVFGTGLSFHFDFDPEQVATAQINALGDYYLATLKSMASQPDSRYEIFNPLSEQERNQLLETWNDTTSNYPKNKCIHELFEYQVKQRPDAVALSFNEETLTYHELNNRADQIAGHLRSRGVQADELVGIFVERSLSMVTAMLAILKAGGAYVPLDPTYPEERLEWIINDSNMQILLTHSSQPLKPPIEKLQVICIDDSPWSEPQREVAASVNSGNLAYVLYTSGSTGVPKGVMIPHRGVVRLLCEIDYVSLDESQIFLHLSSPSFDASTFEVWGALLHGGRCVLLPENELAPKQLGQAIQRHKVTTLWLTAAYYNAVMDETPKILQGVSQLIVGGEALSVGHIRKGLQQLPDTRMFKRLRPHRKHNLRLLLPHSQGSGRWHTVYTHWEAY